MFITIQRCKHDISTHEFQKIVWKSGYIFVIFIVTPIVPSPPVINEHPKNMIVPQGTTVTFNCKAESYGDVTYVWRRVDSGELDVSRATGVNSNRLTISDVSSNDAGSYVCIVSNKNEKTVSRKAVLYVKGM